MQHLSERNCQLIVQAAERCERTLAWESADLAAGRYQSAATLAEAAERDSFLAFFFAGGTTWMVGQ